MAFRASAGRILVTDAADQRIVFDSDEGLFSATDFVAGQITIPERVATYRDGVWNDVNNDIDHPLASVNAAADTVVGAFKVTTTTPQGLHGLGWFNGNGTYVHYVDSNGALTRPDENWGCSSVATFTFRCSGGALVLNERVILQAQGTLSDVTITLRMFAITFDYKLFCGRFV